MTSSWTCPPESVLKDLLEGNLSEPQLSELSEHLEACEGCQQRASTMSPCDTLVHALRSDRRPARRIAAEIPPPLVEKVKSIARSERSAAATAAGAAAESPSSHAETTDLSFLAPPQQPDEIGRLGGYRILEVLGAGGMGVVFLADDPQLGRPVALKVMLPEIAARPSARHRFLREARAAAMLKSDHIVTIYQVGEDRGVPYLAMELLEGMPLDMLLAPGRPLTLPQTLRIGQDVARGLAAAHEKGLIHRDIKPANLWLDESHGGRIKILDFGLARFELENTHITHSGAILGTPAYMAPEQASGDSQVDARADLFSLGCLLYRLCLGVPPFHGETTMSVLLAIAANEFTPPEKLDPTIPRPLSDLIGRLLQKDPARRPASAKETGEALARIARDLAAPTAPREVSGKKTTLHQPANSGQAAFRRRFLAVCLCVGLLTVFLAVGTAGVLRIKTKEGVIVLENLPADVEILVDGEKAVIKTGPDGRSIEVQAAAGERKLWIKADGFVTKTESISLDAGERKPVLIRLEPQTASSTPDAEPAASTGDEQWLRDVAALPASEQVAAVAEKLKERNAGFNGDLTPKIVNDAVAALRIPTDNIADLSPLRAFAQLSRLDLTPIDVSARLVDLSPLEGMPLNQLVLNGCSRVRDLKPLRGMPLTSLNLSHCREVRDLTPLQGMKLTSLVLHACTGISDLAPLKGMPLVHLNLCDCQVRDLTPLEGMPLTSLVLINNTSLEDFSPLQSMPLRSLHIYGVKSQDWTVLKGMPLEELQFSPKEFHSGMEVVRQMERLKKISVYGRSDLMPADEFWKKYDAGEFNAPAPSPTPATAP